MRYPNDFLESCTPRLFPRVRVVPTALKTIKYHLCTKQRRLAGIDSDTLMHVMPRIKNAAKEMAAKEWQLVKHDIEEFVTPAWVNQGKQRAEYLTRVAHAERRMGRVSNWLPRNAIVGDLTERGAGARMTQYTSGRDEAESPNNKLRFIPTRFGLSVVSFTARLSYPSRSPEPIVCLPDDLLTTRTLRLFTALGLCTK